MKTVEDYFSEIRSFKSELDKKNTKTIHSTSYKENVEKFYTDWKSVQRNLDRYIGEDEISEIGENLEKLFTESRSSRPSVKKSAKFLENIEDIFIKNIKHKIEVSNIGLDTVANIQQSIQELSDEKYIDYLEEAAKDIQVESYRSSIVLGWQAVMFAIYKEMSESNYNIRSEYKAKFNRDPGFSIKDFWDFQRMRDKNTLILAEETSVIDKSQKDILDKERNLRNKAAHPGKFDAGLNSTRSFIEKIVDVVTSLEK